MSKFNIGADTKSTNVVHFTPGIQKGFLKSVKVKTVGKEDKEQEALVFNFVSSLKGDVTTLIFDHTEYQLDETNEKFVKNFEAFKSRIKHIYEAFGIFPTEGINVEGENPTFLDFLKAIANTFNKNVGTETEPKTIYQGKRVNLKIILNSKDYIAFPYTPNFIEPADVKVSMLQITKYDKLVATPKANPFAANGGGYPDMGNANADLPF